MWEGRYKSSMVLTQRHFLNCHRYIDLNPVRAGIAERPDDYAWSSHRFYAFGESNSLVRPHEALARLAAERGSLQSEYGTLFSSPLEGKDLEEIRACTAANRVMGDPPKMGRPRKVILAPFF